jgi:hypothetical protein
MRKVNGSYTKLKIHRLVEEMIKVNGCTELLVRFGEKLRD